MALPLKILIMDDDFTIRAALAHALRSRGALVYTCASLDNAMEALQHRPFNVILADLRIRGQESLEGLELLKMARRLQPASRVIVMTASGSDQVEAEVHHHGGTYWAKSRDLDELLIFVTSTVPKDISN